MHDMYFSYEVIRSKQEAHILYFGRTKKEAERLISSGAIRAFKFSQKPVLFREEIRNWLFELDILGAEYEDIMNQIIADTFYLSVCALKDIKEKEEEATWIGFKLDHDVKAAIPVGISISEMAAIGYQISRNYRAFNFNSKTSLKEQIKKWFLEHSILEMDVYLENTRRATEIYLAVKKAGRSL